MPALFLKEKEKKEIKEHVPISTSSFLNKTNITLKQETCCNNHDELFHLGFVLKISLFSGVSLKPSRPSIMEFFAKMLSCYLKKDSS